MALHKLSAISSFKKREDPCVPRSSWRSCNFSYHRQPMSHPSNQTEEPHHDLGLPSFDLFIVSTVQDQFSLPKQHTGQTWSTKRLHLTLHGTSLFPVNLDVFPELLVCRLHSFLNCIPSLSLPIHDTSQDLEMFLQGEPVKSTFCIHIHVFFLLSIIGNCPPQTRGYGQKISPPPQ